MEGEIVELEAAIRTAVVVSDEEITNEKVNVGTTVRVLDQDEDFEDEYRIGGPHEADPMNNAISIDSPVGAALIGKRKGDELTIEIPGGLSHLKVLSIERTERT